ncbi:MAG: hypothetical protein FJ027_14805 [Candidatus Rokubacteria bacterium]|nr:hypothetical protein [Candidatus Rokubacteria bacterium]
MNGARPRLQHVHYCPLCASTYRAECRCRAPEDITHLCATCLDYLFADEKRAA